MNRLHVAMWCLRRLGLRDAVRTTDEGYALVDARVV
jgi:hypothetical protein